MYNQKMNFSKRVNLLRKLCDLKLPEYGSMETHLEQMKYLIDHPAGLGETFAEHLTVAFFLSSLPDIYRTLIAVLETRPEEDLTRVLVMNKRIEEYNRRKQVNSMSNEGEKGQ